jgi:hypothetical protein
MSSSALRALGWGRELAGAHAPDVVSITPDHGLAEMGNAGEFISFAGFLGPYYLR